MIFTSLMCTMTLDLSCVHGHYCCVLSLVTTSDTPPHTHTRVILESRPSEMGGLWQPWPPHFLAVCWYCLDSIAHWFIKVSVMDSVHKRCSCVEDSENSAEASRQCCLCSLSSTPD